MLQTIPGTVAWQSLTDSQSSRWTADLARFRDAPVGIVHRPKFGLAKEDRFFCIGSCFARNIEEHLIYRGCTVLSRAIVSPKNEWPHRPNGFVNKFTTQSMLNEIEWSLAPPQVDESFFESTSSGWLDLQLCPGSPAVGLDRAIERRRYLSSEYFSRLRHASVVVLTLGLNEIWHDAQSDRHLNAPPSVYSVRREPDRYTLRVTGFEENVQALERIKEALALLNPDARLVVTVSPVPMSDTFSGRDVIVANTLSKSVLRVAAETFARRHPSVDYYPSFDMVSISPRDLAYAEDCLHVADRIVGRIMGDFLKSYLGEDVSPPSFNEIGYLAANPDVDAEVRLGQLSSGFEHWLSRGRAEQRPLIPADGPTTLMIQAGAV